MAVITISRELGSGGRDIARQTALALGYDFVDKHTTDEVFRQYGLTKFEDLYSSAPSFLDILNADNLLLVSMANEILEAIAKRGNAVILGRAGFVVLSGYADVLHVRLQAPFEARVQQVMAREGLADPQAAEQRVRDDDDVHRTYVQRFYNKQWDEPSNFALVFDTSAVSSGAIVQQIVEAAKALEQTATGSAAATTALIQADPVLSDAVAEAIAHPPPDLPETAAGSGGA
jgi:cytidylate kinase